MHERVLRIAAAVVAKANRDEPADAALRAALKKEHGLPPDLSRAVTRAVFAFYRWSGWLDRRRSIADQLVQATDFVAEFSRSPDKFPDTEMLARAVPSWVAEQVDVSTAWVRALQTEPRLWLRARVGQGRALTTKLGECWIPGLPLLADAVEYRGHEDLFRTPEFHAGEFEVQDVTSQIVGLVCDPKPGETWWDACAGEGGKLLHLSDLMQNRGLIWASDRAMWRLKRLKLRAARAKVFNYRSVLWNGGEKLPTKTMFDGVLVDAPCSGLGTWQRNPHARWTTRPSDVRELAEVQRQLLARVARGVKPGGKLIYSVCTLTRAETNEVAAAFEKESPEFRPLALPNPFKAGEVPIGPLWMWPQDCGGNGMFIAAWRRAS
jgi:16S rRNA (cytosine967-C5)-methyltransferase